MKNPIISVIMPVYNEGKFIDECLNSLTKQDSPKESFEVLIADGGSTDNTLKIIKKYQNKLNIKLLSNPKKNTASGRNICIEKSIGKYILNYSGHVVAEKNLISTLINKLDKSKKEVGGIGCANYSPNSQNFVGKSVGTVMLSILGGVKSVDQNSNFKEEIEVNSIAFCAYKKNILDKVGLFDENFWVGQDGEFNLRVRKAGYKIIFTPETKVYLFKRNDVKSFTRQMYRYGIAAYKRGVKHKDNNKLVYKIPSLFVICNFLGIITLFIPKIRLFYPLGLIIYSILGWISSIFVTRNPLVVLASPFFYFIEHFAYGIGFGKGLIGHDFNKKK